MYYVTLNLWTKVKLKINQHIQACQTLPTPQPEFIMQKWLQYVKFTGLDTECSLLSKPSPGFRDVSLTKQRSRTDPEPAQTSLRFTAQELFSGWLLRGLWALMGPSSDCGWSCLSPSQSVPIPGWLPRTALPPSLLYRTYPEVSSAAQAQHTWLP